MNDKSFNIVEENNKRVKEYFKKSDPYHEKYRLGYHVSPPIAWLNDPNGLVYYNGVYHIYYQYSAPFFENCAWGHVITKDFVNYKHQPIALYPDKGEGMWSGSIVVDQNNVTKLFDNGSGLVAIYTRFNIENSHQRIEIASSKDGKHFERYNNNPVISNSENIWAFRDPKVFWHQESGKWIAIIAGGIVRFYSSDDLINWEFESQCPEIETECPDIFELKVDNQPDNTKWVLSLGGRYYIIGDFDGHRFKPLSPQIPMNCAADSYALQTFDNIPDGRRISLCWMDCWDNVNRPFQNLSLPIELTLKTDLKGEYALYQFPIEEVKKLRSDRWNVENISILSGEPYECPVKSEHCEIHLDADCKCRELIIKLLKTDDEYTIIGLRPECGETFLDRSHSGIKEYTLKSSQIFSTNSDIKSGVTLDIWVDSGSVEVFVNNGEKVFSSLLYPIGNEGGITIESVGGDCTINNLTVYQLNNIGLEMEI